METAAETRSSTSSFFSQAYAAKWPETVQGTRELYDNWAKTYDPEMKQRGYKGPDTCVNFLEKYLPNKQSRLMDIACGTGLAGEELVKRGYTQIDGLDISVESIKLCQEKKIYHRLVCDKVSTNTLDIEDDTYDAVLCVGCFAPSHMTQECFPELARIAKPGGFILITMKYEYFETSAGFNDGKFESAFQDMVQKGVWEVLVARDLIEGYFGTFKGVSFVFKVL